MVVDLDVVAQRRFKLGGRAKPGLVDDVADAAIKTLDHAVGLRMAWWNEGMLDIKLLAQSVKQVPPAGLFFFALGGKAVGELAAVIGEQLDDLDGSRSARLGQKIDTAAFALVGIDFDEYPARSAVDRDEQVAPCRLVRHLRQVLDIDMDEAGLVVPEGLFRRRHAIVLFDQVAQVGNAVTAQAASKAGARHCGIDELARDCQQVVSRQQQGLAQLDDD